MIQEDHHQSTSKDNFVKTLGLCSCHADHPSTSIDNTKSKPDSSKLDLMTPSKTRKLSLCMGLNSPLSPLAPLRYNGTNLEMIDVSSDDDESSNGSESDQLSLLQVDLTSPLGCKLHSTLSTSYSYIASSIIRDYEKYCNHQQVGEKTCRHLRSLNIGESLLHVTAYMCCNMLLQYAPAC